MSLFFISNLDFLSLSESPFNLFVALCSASFLLSKSLHVEGVFGGNFGLKPELFPKLLDGLKPVPVGFLKFPLPVDLLKPLLDYDKFFFCGLGESKSLKDFFGFPEIVSFVFLFSISHP